MELKTDHARDMAFANGELGQTGIFVRAKRGEKWDSVDIVTLDRPSLMTWLRSRGGDNPWAESCVAILLGYNGEE